MNGDLYVPPVPGTGFIEDGKTQIVWDSEILKSFAELNDITSITFHYVDSEDDANYQIKVGSWICGKGSEHQRQCNPPSRYIPWYIWTKEALKIVIKLL